MIKYPSIVITPLLNREEQITDGAVDVRLGTEFIITKRTSTFGIDPFDKEEVEVKKDLLPIAEQSLSWRLDVPIECDL